MRANLPGVGAGPALPRKLDLCTAILVNFHKEIYKTMGFMDENVSDVFLFHPLVIP